MESGKEDAGLLGGETVILGKILFDCVLFTEKGNKTEEWGLCKCL